MRVPLQIGPVLESAWLAFVNINGHQLGRGLVAHDAPLATGGETCTTQTPQAGIFHGFDDGLNLVLAIHQRCGQAITTLGTIGLVAGVARCHFNGMRLWRNAALGLLCSGKNMVCRGFRVMTRSRFHPCHNALHGGPRYRVLVHHGHGCLFAAPQTGRWNDPHISVTQQGRQTLQ